MDRATALLLVDLAAFAVWALVFEGLLLATTLLVFALALGAATILDLRLAFAITPSGILGPP